MITSHQEYIYIYIYIESSIYRPRVHAQLSLDRCQIWFANVFDRCVSVVIDILS